MKASFLRSMAALHSWGGLVCGWVLVVIFITGTLSVFADPITHWMRAERQAQAVASPAPEVSVRTAQLYLQREASGGREWQINLPTHSDRALFLSWEGGDGSYHDVRLDPATGAVLPDQPGLATNGGEHFVVMHYELQAGMAGFVGRRHRKLPMPNVRSPRSSTGLERSPLHFYCR